MASWKLIFDYGSPLGVTGDSHPVRCSVTAMEAGTDPAIFVHRRVNDKDVFLAVASLADYVGLPVGSPPETGRPHYRLNRMEVFLTCASDVPRLVEDIIYDARKLKKAFEKATEETLPHHTEEII